MRIFGFVFFVFTFCFTCCANKSASQHITPKKNSKTESISTKYSVPRQGRKGALRTVEGNKIIRTIDASVLPFTIGEDLTEENQQFIIIIKNVTKPTIFAKINTVEKGRNLRINQIILPDGSTDGPFSKEMKYAKKKSGTYKIVIGKNSMTEGKFAGNISVTVE